MASASAVADLGKRLLEASRKGTAEEVSHLMATGAPLTTDWLGTSPLHLAAQYGHASTADVLLRAGVSRDGKTKVDKTPLHLACQHGHVEIVKMLVKHGADVHVCDMLNMTPLHWTCERNFPEITKLLLEAGARTDTKNKFGKTPMDIARSRGHTYILQLLKQDYTTSVEARKRQLENDSVFNVEVRKRARTRKFPMTAGSWAGGDSTADLERHRHDKTRRTSLNQKRRGDEDGGRIEGDRSDVENNLSSLVSAAAIVRSKSIDDPKFTAVTAALNQNSADSSVLDTLATLATCAASGTQGLSGGQALPAIAPGYITLSNLQGLQANGGNILAANSLGANIQAGLVSGIQLAPPITLNMIQGVGGRLQMGQQLSQVITSSALPHMVAPSIPHQAGTPTAIGQVVNRDGTPHLLTGTGSGNGFAIDVGGGALAQTVQLGSQELVKASDGSLVMQPTTLSIVGSVPNQSGNKSIAPSQGQPMTSVMSIAPGNTATPQAYPHAVLQAAGVAQGSIPVNIPVSLLNSLIAGGVVQAQNTHVGTGDENSTPLLPRPVTSETLTVSAGISSTINSSNVRVPSPQQAMVAGSSTPIPVLPLAGLGGVQLIPNQALFSQQFVTALRPITPIGSTNPMIQQQGILAGSTIPIPVAPVNLSSILSTAVSLAQLPIAQQQVVTSGQLGTQAGSAIPIIPSFQIDQSLVSASKPSSVPLTSTPAVLSLQNFVRQETSLPKRTLPIMSTGTTTTTTTSLPKPASVGISSGLNLISALVPTIGDDTVKPISSPGVTEKKDPVRVLEEKVSPVPYRSSQQDNSQLSKRQLFPQLQQLINQQQLIEGTENQDLSATSLLTDSKVGDECRDRSSTPDHFDSQLIGPRVVDGTTPDNDSNTLAPALQEAVSNKQQKLPIIPQGLASLLNIASVSTSKAPVSPRDVTADKEITTESMNNESLSVMRAFEQARVDELTREELKKQLAEAEKKSEQYREELEKAQKEINEREEREKQKERVEVTVSEKMTTGTTLVNQDVEPASLTSLFHQGNQESHGIQDSDS